MWTLKAPKLVCFRSSYPLTLYKCISCCFKWSLCFSYCLRYLFMWMCRTLSPFPVCHVSLLEQSPRAKHWFFTKEIPVSVGKSSPNACFLISGWKNGFYNSTWTHSQLVNKRFGSFSRWYSYLYMNVDLAALCVLTGNSHAQTWRLSVFFFMSDFRVVLNRPRSHQPRPRSVVSVSTPAWAEWSWKIGANAEPGCREGQKDVNRELCNQKNSADEELFRASFLPVEFSGGLAVCSLCQSRSWGTRCCY